MHKGPPTTTHPVFTLQCLCPWPPVRPPDPSIRFVPVPPTTPVAGYWAKVPERSAPSPMPIDLALKAGRVARSVHESIKGILVSAASKQHARLRQGTALPSAEPGSSRLGCTTPHPLDPRYRYRLPDLPVILGHRDPRAVRNASHDAPHRLLQATLLCNWHAPTVLRGIICSCACARRAS